MSQNDIESLKKTASQIRRDIVRMVHACQSGHPGGSLGCADFFVALYFRILKHSNKFNMSGSGEDLFLSFEWAHFTSLVCHVSTSRLF